MYCFEKPTSKEGNDLLTYLDARGKYLNNGMTYTVTDIARSRRKLSFMAYGRLYTNVDKFMYATNILSCNDRVEFCVTLRSLEVKPLDVSWVRHQYSHIHARVTVKYLPSFSDNIIFYDSFGLHCNDDICAFVEFEYTGLIFEIFVTIKTCIIQKYKTNENICNEIARKHHVIICPHLLDNCVKSLRLLEKNSVWLNNNCKGDHKSAVRTNNIYVHLVCNCDRVNIHFLRLRIYNILKDFEIKRFVQCLRLFFVISHRS